MNKTIRLALVLVLATTLPLFAEEFLKLSDLAALAKTATAEKHPDSDAVLLDDFIQVEYQPDGTSEDWDDTAIKILTEQGKRDSRTLTQSFNVSYGTAEFTRVQIVKPNGTVHEIDIEA
ncbi:MAG: DUF3857 domain-containing protein, partial [Victivallales bacterium]|nr:DUF3857 domain-containing protein [Victivallales bacterium]